MLGGGIHVSVANTWGVIGMSVKKILAKMLSVVARLLGCEVAPIKDSERGRVFYSQSGEDQIIAYLFGNRRKNLYSYMDLGAADGISASNSYFFYKNYNTNGVLVEADPKTFVELKKNRPKNVLLNVAVGSEDNVEIDYFVGAGTCSKEEAAYREKGGLRIEQKIRVPSTTINTIIANNKNNFAMWGGAAVS
jgi:FkbM family methyltransferase